MLPHLSLQVCRLIKRVAGSNLPHATA